MSYAQQSQDRNRRAGGTGSYEGDSQAREQRLRDRSRKPGESQTSADTRLAASRTTPSRFIPFDVRQAMWEKEGYRGKAAKRMAQFQASTAGQAMGMGGTTENPYGGYDTQNQPTATTPATEFTPDPISGGQAQPGETQLQAQPRAQPGGFLNRLTGEVKSSALGLVSRLAGVQDGSPQANFMRAKADGTLDASGIAKAHEFARSMGTTFDPATGYSRTPFMESARGKSYDPTAEAIEGKKSPSAPTLPAPTGDDVEASFQMPDGTMRTIRANETVQDGFKRTRTARTEKENVAPETQPPTRKKGGMMPDVAAFSPEVAAQKNPILRDQPIERTRPASSAQSQPPPQEAKPKDRPSKPLGPVAQAKKDFALLSSAVEKSAKSVGKAYMDSRSSPEKLKDHSLKMLNERFEKLAKGASKSGAEMPPHTIALFEKQAKANRVKFSPEKGFYK